MTTILHERNREMGVESAASYARPDQGRRWASHRARRRMMRPTERPMFLADWTNVLFIHYAIDPKVLQPHVPFALDLFKGRAYISLVAFTQRNLRPRVGGRLAALASRPLAEHDFLNVRTYVRHGRERGIFFLAEWIPNRLACLLGPRMYGLPYRLARTDYQRGGAPGRRERFVGSVTTPAGRVAWDARFRPAAEGRPARPGLERFLLERYTAYTRRRSTPLRFRVWHEPWVRTRARVRMHDTTLLAAAFPWMAGAHPLAAHFSPGVFNVWIGPPRRVDDPKDGIVPHPFGGPSRKMVLRARAAAAHTLAFVKNFTDGPSRSHFATTKEGV